MSSRDEERRQRNGPSTGVAIGSGSRHVNGKMPERLRSPPRSARHAAVMHTDVRASTSAPSSPAIDGEIEEDEEPFRQLDGVPLEVQEAWICAVSYTHLTLPTKRIV